jgi:Protein of unknown function (DUF3157)
MIRLLTTLLLLIVFTSSKSQVKALTENGREVLLNEDGTWRYSTNEDDSLSKSEAVTTNPIEFHTTAGASFPVKSSVLNVGVYLDPNKWTFSAHHSNEVNPEYRFVLKSQHGFAMMLTEITPIDLENMKVIALENAKKAAPDTKVTHTEYRTVNNKKVLCLTLRGTLQGIKFIYFGYYYSNSNGTVQLVAYGSENMFKDSIKEWEDFLNGFTVLN